MDDPVEIARRKERLIARCAAQRDSIAGAFRELRQPIAVVDRAVAAVRFLRAHPALVVAAVAVVVAFRRRNLLALAGRGFAAWRMWRAIAAWADGVGAGLRRAGSPGER